MKLACYCDKPILHTDLGVSVLRSRHRKDGPSYRDNRSRCSYHLGVRTAAQLLNLHTYVTQEYMEELPPFAVF